MRKPLFITILVLITSFVQISNTINAKTLQLSPHITYKGKVIKNGKTIIPNGEGSILISHGERWTQLNPTATDGYTCTISGLFSNDSINQGTIACTYLDHEAPIVRTKKFRGDLKYKVIGDSLLVSFNSLKDQDESNISDRLSGYNSVFARTEAPAKRNTDVIEISDCTIIFSSEFPIFHFKVSKWVFPKLLTEFNTDFRLFYRKSEHYGQVHIDYTNRIIQDEIKTGELSYSDENGNIVSESVFYGYSQDGRWIAMIDDNGKRLYVQLPDGKWLVNIPERRYSLRSQEEDYMYEIYKDVSFSEILDSVKLKKSLNYTTNGYYRGSFKKQDSKRDIYRAKSDYDISQWPKYQLSTYKNWESLKDYFDKRKSAYGPYGQYPFTRFCDMLKPCRKTITDSNNINSQYSPFDPFDYYFDKLLNSDIEVSAEDLALYNDRDTLAGVLNGYTYDWGEMKDGRKYYGGIDDKTLDKWIEQSRKYFFDVYLGIVNEEQQYLRDNGFPKSWDEYAQKYGKEVIKKYYDCGSDGYYIGMPEQLWLEFNQLENILTREVYNRKPSSTYTSASSIWHVYHWNKNKRGYTLWFKNGILNDILSHDSTWGDVPN